MPQNTSNFLDAFLEELRVQKTAGAKSAAPLSEAGGYQGQSSHPSAQVDDHLIESRTGARASENESDVKENREKPTVDATADATAGADGQDKRQLNIGTQQAATGEQPAVEDDFKGNKEDPGTSSVMKADDGEKYAALAAHYQAMPTEKLASAIGELGNELLADVYNGRFKHAGAAPANGRTPANGRPADPAVKAAAEAGYALAAAPSADARAIVASLIKEADVSADLLAYFVAGEKQAGGDDEAAGEQHMPPPEAVGGGPPGMDGGPPPMGGGPPGMPGAGGPPGMPGAGGMPPGLEQAIAGQPGGGAEGPGGPGGGQVAPEEALTELASAFHEMGLTPDEVMSIAQQMETAGGPPGAGGPPPGAEGPPPGAGGPPPGAGGPPPDEKMAMARTLHKAASAVKRHKLSGAYAYRPAPPNSKAAALRERMRSFVVEACSAR